MLVQVLVDNPGSWVVPYAAKLVEEIKSLGFESRLLHQHADVVKGEVLCLLSCEQIFKDLTLNARNLVVHESELPKGKGWSPLTWQVLEGKKSIPITLFEATEKVDAGAVYERDCIPLEGHELIEEIKHLQGEYTNRMILNFLKKYPEVEGVPQSGEESFYPKRTGESSALDLDKTIREQFNLLRVCDNERYPAYFELNGQRYNLKISKA